MTVVQPTQLLWLASKFGKLTSEDLGKGQDMAKNNNSREDASVLYED